MKADINEVKKIIRALLLSTKNGLTASELCSEYSAITGQALPYKELGFFSAVDLIKDMPDVVRPVFLSGGVMLLKGIADSSTAHINELVRRQKSTGHNTKIIRNEVKKAIKLVVPDYIRNKVCTLIKGYPKGIEIIAFDRAYTKFYGRKIEYRSFGFNDLKSVLAKCQDILTMRRVSDKLTFLYPVNVSVNKSKPLLPQPRDASYPYRIQSQSIPQSIKLEIYSLLCRFMFGLQSSRFMSEYQTSFKKQFKLHELGFNSVIELMSKIPEIVVIERPVSGGDWILQPVLTSKEKLSIIATATCAPKVIQFEHSETIELFISYIVSPSSFWFQKADSVKDLENLMESMNLFYDSSKGDSYASLEFQHGQVCCALYDEDKQWYRAIVKNMVSKDMVQVHYVDYGNETTVNKKSLRLLLQEFYTLPFQAHQGKLNGINPNDDLWSGSAIKDFFNLTQDQRLHAEVVQIERAVVTDLFMNRDKRESIAQILADNGHGNCTAAKQNNESIENLKNYYQRYYEALKQVSSLPTTIQPKKNGTTSIIQDKKDVKEIVKLLKTIHINENMTIAIVKYKNQPFVSSAEISSLFWNADILRQMSRQKDINLIREVVSSDESPKTLELLSNNNVKGIIECDTHQSIIMYQLEQLQQLFTTFHTNYENSGTLIRKEIELWNDLGEEYWAPKYNTPTESESKDFKIQALKFKKKRLYMSMITNSADDNTMDEILAIEKEINLLTLS